MIRKLAIYFAMGSIAAGVYSCNGNEAYIVEDSSAAAAVRTFSFTENDSILANLDSVFFSIDLVKGRIFNADSMPKGTDVTGLVPVITTLNGCSVAQLTVSRAGKPDTVYNYLDNPSDPIDFTNPVTLRLVSPDGLVERNYTIKVNVHKVEADSLEWARIDRRTIPTTFTMAEKQHTVRQADKLHCLSYYQGSYCLATTTRSIEMLTGTDPDLGPWNFSTVTFPAAVDINSFTASESALYILGTDGTLYTSADGSSWTSTGRKWHFIYGAYGNDIHGSCKNSDGSWTIESYPAGTSTPLINGMPVSGTSAPVYYSFSMSNQQQMLIVGGRNAAGTVIADTWGFDGSSWAKLSKRPLPVALENAAVAPYVTYTTTAAWTQIYYPTLVLIGGRKANGSINTTVYTSNDYGYNWGTAGVSLQLPTYMPALHNSQAFVISSKLDGSIASPKITTPVETWDCPYLYLFGGVNRDGATSNNVWRGVINNLRFKPVE